MWVHTNTPTWEHIGDDNGLTWVYTNTHTWELTLIHLCGNAYVQWVYTNTHTRELNRYRPDQTRPDRTRPDQTRQTHFKSFQCTETPSYSFSFFSPRGQLTKKAIMLRNKLKKLGST